jgi:hypothetical protein
MKRLFFIPLLCSCLAVQAQKNQISLSAGGSINTQPSHYKFLDAVAALSPAVSIKYGHGIGHGLRLGAELNVTKWQNKAELMLTPIAGPSEERMFRYVFANPALTIGVFISKDFSYKNSVFSVAPSVGYVSVINTNGLKDKDGYPVSNGLGKGQGFYAGAKLSWLYAINKNFSIGPEVNVRYTSVSTTVEDVSSKVKYNLFYFPVMAQVAYNL